MALKFGACRRIVSVWSFGSTYWGAAIHIAISNHNRSASKSAVSGQTGRTKIKAPKPTNDWKRGSSLTIIESHAVNIDGNRPDYQTQIEMAFRASLSKPGCSSRKLPRARFKSTKARPGLDPQLAYDVRIQ